jgi:hypothetical protein
MRPSQDGPNPTPWHKETSSECLFLRRSNIDAPQIWAIRQLQPESAAWFPSGVCRTFHRQIMNMLGTQVTGEP